MHFIPYKESAHYPNIIVDGAANEASILTLSHWPRSGTPKALLRDTSAEIAFAYLDAPEFHVDAEAVSNNHFDQDGLVGLFILLQPRIAGDYRNLLVDVATAGDFGVYQQREAARIAFAISSFSDPQFSPLPPRVFRQSYPEMAAELYVELLKVFSDLIKHVDDYQSLWESEDRKLTESENLLAGGTILIDEEPDLDLAIVRSHATCHPMALHRQTSCSRVALVRPQKIEFQYRYESWVQFVSRRPPARVELSSLAERLNEQEQSKGRWVFDGVDQIIPWLRFGGEVSSIPPEEVLQLLRESLRKGLPAWNPYASTP